MPVWFAAILTSGIAKLTQVSPNEVIFLFQQTQVKQFSYSIHVKYRVLSARPFSPSRKRALALEKDVP